MWKLCVKEWGCTNLTSYLGNVLLASLSRYGVTFQERVYHHLCSLVGFGTSTKNSAGYFEVKNFKE